MEWVSLGLITAYIAFYTNPPPSHIADFLSSSIGKAIALIGVGLVTVCYSCIVGIFLAIAFLMSAGRVTEYLDEKEQKQPSSKGVPAPEMKGALASMLKGHTGPAFKGDNRLPSSSNKKGTAPSHASKAAAPPKGVSHKAIETFASF